MNYIDLTQSLKPGIPDWVGCCGSELHEHMSVDSHGVQVQSMKTPLGIGTHMDAPCHFIQGGRDIAALSIEELILPAVVIDVREHVHPDYFISVEDIKSVEKQHGSIAPNNLVLGLTGWSQYWDNPDKYRGEDENGHKHFPGFSEEAIVYLLEKDIAGIGIDTLSPDGSYHSFPGHHLLLGAGKYIIENLTNLDKLPATGSVITALPIKIEGGSEAPCRVVAKLTHKHH